METDPIEHARWCEREIARLTAEQFDALVQAAGAERQVKEFLALDRLRDEERRIRIEDAAAEEIAAALRWSPITARHRVDTGRLLAGPLLGTRQALGAGEISAGHVHVIVEAACRFEGRWAEEGPEQESFQVACAALERRVLPVARRGTPSMTRAAARRAVLAIDAAGHQRRRERAQCARDVYVVHELDGLSTLIAVMSTVDAHAVMTAVNAASAGRAEPSAGQRRAGALRDLVLAGGDVSVNLDVVIDLPTVLGLSDQPASLRGAGPISVDEVRELLEEPAIGCTLRRLVADPVTGHLLDRGRRTYAVPDDLRAFITARDQTCRFPGCRRRASRCQIDHAEPWDDGGDTSRQNLGALCTRHHQLKTHAGWRLVQSHADGSAVWESPQGRTYLHDPPPLAA